MKRRRMDNSGNYNYNTPRPYNKKVVNVAQSPSTTQASVQLSSFTISYPRTFKLSSISISAIGNGTAATTVRWAILKVPDGYTENTISMTNGASLYDPESDILAFGVFNLADSDSGTGSTTAYDNIKVSASRKLQQGDEIAFVSITDNATAISLDAIISWIELL